eukprot:TRINITY_DN1759_c0_g1_i2.p2 TRINITY_DN1759_c0_g1~~TRINITY_DN1759_c0_g1_i2.p2  ORF type:complete len:233 (+),score=42.18 TRINITY_DN1759_c0_g1_i2:1103-1801(+)
MAPRQLHRALSIFVLFPLFLTALTGCAYRFCRNALGMEKEKVAWLLHLHNFDLFGLEWLSVLYVTFLAFGVLFMVVTGVSMLSKNNNKILKLQLPTSFRQVHHSIAFIVFPFLSVSAITGWLWRICWTVFGIQEKARVSWLLKIHQASYIPGAPVVYTLILFLLVAALVISGSNMVPYIKQLFAPKVGSGRSKRKLKADSEPLINGNSNNNTIEQLEEVIGMGVLPNKTNPV